MTAPHPNLRHRRAVACAFGVQGFTFVALTAKLPQLQDSLDLSPSAFSVLMLALVLAAGVGSVAGEWVAGRAGSAAVLRLGFLVTAGTLPALAWAPGVAPLAGAMAAYGGSLGLVDAGSNMQAVSLEHRYGRPILPTFHAAWTCGGIVGTLAALATHGWSFRASVSGLVLAPVLAMAAPYLPHARPQEPVATIPTHSSNATNDTPPETGLPWRRILTLGLALVVFYMVDTAITTWAPTYVHRTFHSGDALVAVATLPYLVGSLVSRAAGDHLTSRFGATKLVRVAGLIGALGLATAVVASSAELALVGMAVAGLSLAVVAPLAYSSAARLARHGHGDAPAAQATTDAVIARFNQFNYVGGLLGAVLTGALGDASLRYGFAVPAVLVLALVPLARAFRPADA